jgi:hypothetical protein
LAGASEAVILHEPLGIVVFNEIRHGQADVLQGMEDPAVDRLKIANLHEDRTTHFNHIRQQ